MPYNDIAMDYLIKAHFENDNETLKLSMPISKVDVEKRIVSGFATLDNVDRQGDKVLIDASLKAFEKFRGNVRLMHQPIPAGKLVSFRQNDFFDPETKKTYTGVFVDAYISKGAENIWQMVLDGTLTGFSIGGKTLETEMMMEDEDEKPVRIVKEYELTELSLVDTPANQLANIFSIQKTDDGRFIADGIFNKSNIQNVYWCEGDKKAFLSEADAHECVFCKNETSQIGWIDETDQDGIAKAMSSIIKSHTVEKDVMSTPPVPAKNPKQGVKGGLPKKTVKKKKIWKSVPGLAQKGDFVIYKNNNSYEKGQVTEIKESGTFKFNKSGKTIKATKENPVAIISVYKQLENGKHSLSKKVTARNISDVQRLKVSSLVNQKEPKDTWVEESMGEYSVQVAKTKEGDGSKMKKFLSRLFGVKNEIGLPEENLVEKTLDNDILIKSLNSNTNEGGVEMAENTDSHEELDTAQAEETTETVETEEVEFEIEETVEEVVEETSDVVEKSHDPEEETEAAADASEEVEISKALDEIKSFIGESLSKSFDSTNDSLSKVNTVVEGLVKSFDEKVGALHSKYEELEKSLVAIINRVESVEKDTAIKKSGEFEGALPEVPETSKSLWGGRFLGKENIFN